eukprot:12914524-Prorocentrum_lima.AAC.1
MRAFLIQVMHRLSSHTCPFPVSFTPRAHLFHSPGVDDMSAPSAAELLLNFLAASATALRAHELVGLP